LTRAAARQLTRPRRIVEDAGGFDAQLAEIEAVSAHRANNYMPLVEKHRRRDRATMFAFTSVVELEATSADRSVLNAVEHAVAHAHLTRDFIPDHVDGVRVDLSFASEQWQRTVVDRGHRDSCIVATSKRASSRTSRASCGLDDLLLLGGVVALDRVVAEPQPGGELVVGLDLVRRGGDLFGEYATDGLIDPPDACDPHLALPAPTAAQAA
jgi:hypothetical protein